MVLCWWSRSDSDFEDASSTSLYQTLLVCACWRLLVHCVTVVRNDGSHLATVTDLCLPCYSLRVYGTHVREGLHRDGDESDVSVATRLAGMNKSN